MKITAFLPQKELEMEGNAKGQAVGVDDDVAVDSPINELDRNQSSFKSDPKLVSDLSTVQGQLQTIFKHDAFKSELQKKATEEVYKGNLYFWWKM